MEKTEKLEELRIVFRKEGNRIVADAYYQERLTWKSLSQYGLQDIVGNFHNNLLKSLK